MSDTTEKVWKKNDDSVSEGQSGSDCSQDRSESGDSESHISSNYTYKPLTSSDSIRMLRILPGAPEDPLKITLHPQRVFAMRICSAVSYEWGGSARPHTIYCDDKALMVTSNLLALLKRLRMSRETSLLWVDAICIDQDNLQERSQQVPLMGDIYRQAAVVLIWLGPAQPLTEDAFEIISILAEEFRPIRSQNGLERNIPLGEFKAARDIQCGGRLETLIIKPAWSEVMRLYSSTSYFLRLWVKQEIVLARDRVVICGTQTIDWEVFYTGALCIWQCEFLCHNIDEIEILSSIFATGRIVERFSTYPHTLESLMLGFALETEVTDPRDRVFGLLGMLPEGEQKSSIIVDYTRSVDMVYRNAFQSIVETENTIRLWQFLDVGLDLKDERTRPTWVASFSSLRNDFSFPTEPLMQLFQTREPISIQGDTLTVHGVISDSIIQVSENFSETNQKACVQSILDTPDSEILNQMTYGKFVSLWQTLIAFSSTTDEYEYCEQGFLALLSKWDLRPSSEDESYDEQREDYAFQMKSQLIRGPEYEYGRSLFKTSRGFYGVGPRGKNNGEQGSRPQVQVGDRIALVATANTPVILRPRDDDCYALVGAAYVGCLQDATGIWEENVPDLEPIRIR